MPSEVRLEIFFFKYKIRALNLPQKVHFNKQIPKRQEKGGQGGHFAQKGGKIALCGLRWFKLYVSRFKRCQMSNSQTFGLWRRFTKRTN